MKKFIVPACLCLVFFLFPTVDTPAISIICDLPEFVSSVDVNDQNKTDQQVKTVYTCPMHPEVVQDKPGKCPKCGMDLTAKEVKKDTYLCPMHTEVTQDKPGKCPKCGMNLALKEPVKVADPPKK